jgi:hypothetical protein
MSHDPHILLEQYAEDVCHPEVSGFELLEILSLRSALVEGETNLSPVQRRRLEEADARLLAAAPIVLARLAEVAPLVELRQRVNVSPSHWWWYLDLLQQATRVLSSAESKKAS